MNIAVLVPFFLKKISDFEDFIVETISHFVVQHPNDKFFILTNQSLSKLTFPVISNYYYKAPRKIRA